MYNILVTGGNGQLGSEIRVLEKNYPKFTFFFTDVAALDITNKEAIKKFVSKNEINCIINCAAYTKVDKAESEFELANKINHLAVKYLAEIAKNHSCKLIHISTDYVFDGISYKPYIETDVTNPQNVYGTTKLDGELVMRKVNPENSIIIRTSWVYSNFGNNFVKTMLRLGSERDVLNVIQDQVGTPTNAADLAKAILEIVPKIESTSIEIYNYSNEGECSWFNFANSIFEYTNNDIIINKIVTSQYPTLVKRPLYSVLDKTKIKNVYGLAIPHWKVSLKTFLFNLDNKKHPND